MAFTGGRRFLSWSLTLVLLLALPAVGWSHGALKSSSPARDASLTRLPANLVLTFTERVELSVARIFLVRNEGDTIALSALRSDSGGRAIVADIHGTGGIGSYVIHWLVSGRDGHPVRGTIPFRVTSDSGLVTASGQVPSGAPDTLLLRSPSLDTALSPKGEVAGGIYASSGALHSTTRWVAFVAYFVLVGSVLAIVLVARALSRQGRSAFAQTLSARATTTAMAATVMLMLTDAARLVLQQRSLNADGASVAFGAVVTTTWGQAWLLRIIASFVALVAVIVARRSKALVRRAALLVVMLAVAVVAVGMALSGHAAAAAAPLLPVIYDSVHMLAAASWIGTLAMVLLVALPRLQSDPSTALISLRTFSAMGVLAVIVLLGTGVLSAWTHIGGFEALTGSTYGKVLLAKLAIVAIILLLGGRNRLRIRSDSNGTDVVRSVGRTGRLEIVFALVVLGVTAVLVSTPTPPGALH